ncbi:protein PHYTOCHROME KINASE SUBSTRATE 3-like [Bidens hawaiensis]|uniref:protein PHYTOCHROME KINASE SUBSTRATE 3-like n=1 Tax=Bidens hawaiensis TaxID=980011 RepID=UPI00404A9E86
MGTDNNPNDLRAASFSCYLKPIDDVANMFDHHPSTHDQKFTDMSVMDLHRVKPSIFTARTPSLASEASSWSNNQVALLRKPSSGGKRWFQGCIGPCSTRKDVYVQQSTKKGHDQFAFPVMNPTLDIMTKQQDSIQELPRMSIEVFGSGTINKGDIAKNLVRKMSILTWDAIPKTKESVICDDMASEASSDLFEIENISRTGWQPSESSCMSPSTQYAPSEASIEWSVVTASAAEYSSVYSGYDEKHMVYNTSSKNKTEQPKKSPRKLDNGLLGCKNFKSVKVVEPVCRMTDKSKY